MIKFICSLLILLMQDASEKISVSSSISKTQMKIGDKITYKIRIDYDKSLKIEAPGSAINLGYFEIKDYKIHPPKEVENRIVEMYEYTISTYDTGKFIIPPFPVAFFETEARTDFNYIEAPEQELYVESIFVQDSILNEQPKPIKALKTVAEDVNYWLWGLLLFACLLCIGFAVWYFKFRRVEEDVKVITPLEAHEIALRDLKEIEGFTSDNLYEVNVYYTNLSTILRRYLEQRYGISALEQTTTELRVSLKTIEITSKDFDRLIELLPKADMVKFAKECPPENEFTDDFLSIKEFVLRSKPAVIAEATDE